MKKIPASDSELEKEKFEMSSLGGSHEAAGETKRLEKRDLLAVSRVTRL